MPRLRRRPKQSNTELLKLVRRLSHALGHGYDGQTGTWVEDATPDDVFHREVLAVAWPRFRVGLIDAVVQTFLDSPFGFYGPRRPWAFWEFDASETCDETADQGDRLYRLGALTDEEIELFEERKRRRGAK